LFHFPLIHNIEPSTNGKQEWLYDEGEDTTKAVYVAKMDEIRAITGPIVQRYNDKIEEERAAAQAIADAEAARKREMAEAAKQAAMAQEAANSKDSEMTDAEPQKPDEISEPEK
jgi:heat shock protein 4